MVRCFLDISGRIGLDGDKKGGLLLGCCRNCWVVLKEIFWRVGKLKILFIKFFFLVCKNEFGISEYW